MKEVHAASLSYFSFPIFAKHKDLLALSLSRKGGYSQGKFQGLNLGENVGDEPKDLEKNLELISKYFKIHSLSQAKQVHGTHFSLCEKKGRQFYPNSDILLSNKANIALLIKHADCQAAIFYDPIRKAIANVHCGWRGNVANIYQKTIEVLEKHYGSKREELLVAISPSLGPFHAEFIHYKTELQEEFWKYRQGNFFNFWEISQMQLIKAGLNKEQIQIAKLCSYEDSENFYSYRREKKTGRMGTLVTLL